MGVSPTMHNVSYFSVDMFRIIRLYWTGKPLVVISKSAGLTGVIRLVQLVQATLGDAPEPAPG